MLYRVFISLKPLLTHLLTPNLLLTQPFLPILPSQICQSASVEAAELEAEEAGSGTRTSAAVGGKKSSSSSDSATPSSAAAPF